MPYYPDVRRGQPVKHYVSLENDLRRMVNASNGMTGKTKRGNSIGPAKIKVWNASGNLLTAGSAVQTRAGGQLVNGDTVPVDAFRASEREFFVLKETLAVNETGEALTAGAVIVSVDGEDVTEWVRPAGGKFIFCEEDYAGAKAKVISQHGKKCVILLNSGNPEAANQTPDAEIPIAFSARPFALTLAGRNGSIGVNAGAVNVNGIFHSIPPKDVDISELPKSSAQQGYLCVHSEPRPAENGWTAPEIILTPDPYKYDFPIGFVWWDGAYHCEDYFAPMAIILESAECSCNG